MPKPVKCECKKPATHEVLHRSSWKFKYCCLDCLLHWNILDNPDFLIREATLEEVGA